MKLRELPLLTDENIQSKVVQWLSEQGMDVISIVDRGLTGASDDVILAAAHEEGRAVLTHDSDFGLLSVMRQTPLTGVVYIRPGHIRPHIVIETLQALLDRSIEVNPPFLLVANRRGDDVAIRIRPL